MLTIKHYIQTSLIISLLLILQTLTYGQTVINYEYDANGNRILRKVVQLRIKQQNDTIVNQDETIALLEEKNEEPKDKTETDEQEIDTPIVKDQKQDETSSQESSAVGEQELVKTSTENNNATANTSAAINTPNSGVTALADQVTVYPNPTRGALSIQGNTNETTIQLQLRDMNGKLISERQLAPQSTQHVNMRNQPNGNYLLQLIAPNNTTETITIIKTE